MFKRVIVACLRVGFALFIVADGSNKFNIFLLRCFDLLDEAIFLSSMFMERTIETKNLISRHESSQWKPTLQIMQMRIAGGFYGSSTSHGHV